MSIDHVVDANVNSHWQQLLTLVTVTKGACSSDFVNDHNGNFNDSLEFRHRQFERGTLKEPLSELENIANNCDNNEEAYSLAANHTDACALPLLGSNG